ncbi:MAG TPA: SIMPL domain-containing protein [Acidimicrobiales bacterium]|nr:SIMPL domain-containing protein [Acidimicrobiales bacterium]
MSDAAPTTSHRPFPGAAVALSIALVLAVVAGAAVYAWGRGSTGTGRTNTITVTGSGTVMGTPDTATVQLGVQTTAATATAALNENNTRVARLIRALEAHGIAKKDLQTSGLNLWDNTNSNGTVISFSVSNQLTVTIHHLSTAGAAIDAAANAVGNGIQLNGITLSISHDSALLVQARERAIRNARSAAGEIARAGGASLGGLVSVVDLENQNTEILPVFGTPTAAQALKSVPVEAGSQSVSVQVRAVFAL